MKIQKTILLITLSLSTCFLHGHVNEPVAATTGSVWHTVRRIVWLKRNLNLSFADARLIQNSHEQLQLNNATVAPQMLDRLRNSLATKSDDHISRDCINNHIQNWQRRLSGEGEPLTS